MQSDNNNSFSDYKYKEVLPRIPLNSKVILEIGCGDGLLGYEFKKKNPATRYIGIDSSGNDNQIAIQRLDSVFFGDIEDYSILLDKIPMVDCLILSNVFQYIQKPGRFLDSLSEILKEEAIIITIFSNSRNWIFLKNFFNGDNFSDNDLFTQNAFHKLSPDSIKLLFQNTTFKLFDIVGVSSIIDKQKCNNFINKFDKSISDLGINKEKFIERISPTYYIARAGYSNNNIKQKIDVLIGEQDIKGVCESRIIVPYRSMSSQFRLDINISDQITLNNNIYDYPKVFIFTRPIHTRNNNDINKIKKLISNNYLVIIDYDDDPNIITKIHPQFTDWDFTFKSAHAIQTTNLYLANYLKSFNPEVKVFTNSISQIGELKEPSLNSYLRVFFGAINRKNDWMPWIDTLNNISKKYTKKLFFDIVHDVNFYNSLDVPKSQKRFTPTCEYSKYLEIMKGCDICFLPLNNNHFNNCKSDLKAVEAASFGLALLASPVVYKENFRDGIEASFFEDRNKLTNILTDWINNPIKVGLIGRNAQDYVLKNRLFCYQFEERKRWYDDLWTRKNDLTRAIYSREADVFKP